MENLGFLDCREKDLLQKEETEAIMGIKITGENFDTATKNFVEDKEEISIKVDDALEGKKKNMLLLSLDYEGVISAWAEKKRPWLIGDRRPELNLDDWWPQCMVKSFFPFPLTFNLLLRGT